MVVHRLMRRKRHQVACRMLQNGLDLAAHHTGEPLEKLLDGRSVLKVLEQRFDRTLVP